MTRSPKIEELAQATSGDSRWPSVVARDPSADGKFFFAVKTTGVYCRPSCAARLARPENVEYFENGAETEKAGFRPCKRCKPSQAGITEQNASKIAEACRLIEKSEEIPSLARLAKHVGMSLYHFHRTLSP